MRHISYPPIIILLDILFVFLFILMLDEKKVINVYPPKEKVFVGATLLYYDQNQKKYLDEQNVVYNFQSIHNLLLACENQRECIDVKRKYGTDRVFMLLPKKLFIEMSEINMLAFGTNSCTKLDFVIKEDGELDYEKLIQENTCLLKIPGFKT